MSRPDIAKAYRRSRTVYDDVLTQRTWWSRLYMGFFWQGVSDLDVADRLLSRIPGDFAGTALDVPVGTAIFTADTYRGLPAASITGLDYSADMLDKARRNLDGVPNVVLTQGDVGALPYDDHHFDLVITMNGIHAFPDKDAAFAQMRRVLRPGGTFMGCTYVRGTCRRTDLLVRHVLARKGWFTPPFDTEESLRERLRALYSDVTVERHGSMASFVCV